MAADCDVRGNWQLLFTQDPAMPGALACGGTVPGSLEVSIRAADSGGFQVRNMTGAFSGSTCQLELTSKKSWSNASELGYVSNTITLTLSGDTATGTFEWSTGGFCSSHASGSVLAHRVREPWKID